MSSQRFYPGVCLPVRRFTAGTRQGSRVLVRRSRALSRYMRCAGFSTDFRCFRKHLVRDAFRNACKSSCKSVHSKAVWKSIPRVSSSYAWTNRRREGDWHIFATTIILKLSVFLLQWLTEALHVPGQSDGKDNFFPSVISSIPLVPPSFPYCLFVLPRLSS